MDMYSRLLSVCVLFLSIPPWLLLALSWSSLSGVKELGRTVFPGSPKWLRCQQCLVSCASLSPQWEVALKIFWGFLSWTWASTTQRFQTNPIMRLKMGTRRYPGIKTQVRAATEIHKAGAQLLSWHTHLSQHVWPTLTTPARAPFYPPIPLGLIKLAQDDTNNWLKMGLRQAQWSISSHSLKSVLSALCWI